MKLIIKGRMPSLNDYTKANRGKIAWGNSMKQEWTSRIAWECKAQGLEPAKEPATLQFKWYCENRRQDPDNIVFAKKFILDGLQQAGILTGDGWKQIKAFSDEWEKDKENPKVEVIIN